MHQPLPFLHHNISSLQVKHTHYKLGVDIFLRAEPTPESAAAAYQSFPGYARSLPLCDCGNEKGKDISPWTRCIRQQASVATNVLRSLEGQRQLLASAERSVSVQPCCSEHILWTLEEGTRAEVVNANCKHSNTTPRYATHLCMKYGSRCCQWWN